MFLYHAMGKILMYRAVIGGLRMLKTAVSLSPFPGNILARKTRKASRKEKSSASAFCYIFE